MLGNLKKVISTCKESGLTGLVKRVYRYVTNVRVRRENFIWFVKRIPIRHRTPVTRVHDFKFHVRANDPGISRELAIYHTHEPLATDVFKNEIRKGMCEIDIGSNLGYYALLASRLVGAHGKVLAIEPEPINYHMLKTNVSNNNIRNLDTYQCAIGDTDGVSEFFITEASNTNSLIVPITGKVISSMSINARKLDSLLDELHYTSVDFIRMDIEGGETIAIKGMQKTLTKHKPRILIELHCDAVGTDSIITFLKKLGSFNYIPLCLIDRDHDFIWMKQQHPFKLKSMDELISIIPRYRVATVLLS